MIETSVFKIFLSFLLVSIAHSLHVTSNADTVLIDDFQSGNLDNWKSRSGELYQVYNIGSDGNGDEQYLQASSLGSDDFIIKKIKIDIVKYPYLNWRWRAHSLPINGDESVKATCDVAASVNVVLKASKWRPKTIKYSWSTNLEKGSFAESPFAIWPSRADIIVVESGEALKGEWIHEKVNVLEDYKRLYNKNKVDSYYIEAFVIMTDSDNTNSLSAADYDDIFFSKN